MPGKDDDREGSAENTEGPLGAYPLGRECLGVRGALEAGGDVSGEWRG